MKVKTYTRVEEREEDNMKYRNQQDPKITKGRRERIKRKSDTQSAQKQGIKERPRRELKSDECGYIRDKLHKQGVENYHTKRLERDFQHVKATNKAFKARMIKLFGKTFFYKGGSWHGVESRRYRVYNISKSMRFLQSNMQE